MYAYQRLVRADLTRLSAYRQRMEWFIRVTVFIAYCSPVVHWPCLVVDRL